MEISDSGVRASRIGISTAFMASPLTWWRGVWRGEMAKVPKSQSRWDLSFWKRLFPTQGLTSLISKYL